jgi:predicted dehydrogenase
MGEMKYAGLIECGDSTTANWPESQSEFDGFHLKKILFKNIGKHSKEYYPQAEMVQDTQSIIQDETIELVILSAPAESDLNLVAQAIEAGKQVRVL